MTALSGGGGRFSDDLRRSLRSLERVKVPSEWQRGQLAALRMAAALPADLRRAEELAERWRAVR